MLAPADGTVIEVVSDIADNSPVGTMNAKQPAGNRVVIDHGNGEYSLLLAHLKMGSAKVQKGAIVKKGDLVGLCGNSGNSSEAHIHFQVSNNPTLDLGKALPVRYEGDVKVLQGQTLVGS
ncbi:M23 family metallopeptidase [Paenibacillus sp. SYP-B3998]|uniref:M23 family metallopeptidase n=1 Tax=Paenibacillus sp. SYP-B3998 TaxID=2678564 RepID=A0A6G4A4F5_9BACL|nr:M23 family metallopeptidase [Paenibacillus sp. SYP-B3998]